MKIITLMENTAAQPSFLAEHGLSLYVETNGLKILFDAGQSDGFAQNARQLGVDLSQVDLAILSHGHYDHGGGLATFLRLNDHAPVYLSGRAFSDCWHGEDHFIGIAPALKDSRRLIRTGDECRIADGLTLLSCNAMERRHSAARSGLTIRQPDGTFAPDDFLHEQYLLVEENGKRLVLSGCSHKGILNIVEWLKPDVLIGGFHLMKLDPIADAWELAETADVLCAHPTVYYTCHCTGPGPYEALKARMGDRLHAIAAGDILRI